MSSRNNQALIAAAVIVSGLVGLAALHFLRQDVSKTKQKKGKGKGKKGEEKDEGKTLSKMELVEILTELEGAAQMARESIMKAQTSAAERAKMVSDEQERKLLNVQLIVKALAPVEMAKLKFQNQKGIGEQELHFAILAHKADADVSRLNDSIQQVHKEIRHFSRLLVS